MSNDSGFDGGEQAVLTSARKLNKQSADFNTELDAFEQQLVAIAAERREEEAAAAGAAAVPAAFANGQAEIANKDECASSNTQHPSAVSPRHEPGFIEPFSDCTGDQLAAELAEGLDLEESDTLAKPTSLDAKYPEQKGCWESKRPEALGSNSCSASAWAGRDPPMHDAEAVEKLAARIGKLGLGTKHIPHAGAQTPLPSLHHVADGTLAPGSSTSSAASLYSTVDDTNPQENAPLHPRTASFSGQKLRSVMAPEREQHTLRPAAKKGSGKAHARTLPLHSVRHSLDASWASHADENQPHWANTGPLVDSPGEHTTAQSPSSRKPVAGRRKTPQLSAQLAQSLQRDSEEGPAPAQPGALRAALASAGGTNSTDDCLSLAGMECGPLEQCMRSIADWSNDD